MTQHILPTEEVQNLSHEGEALKELISYIEDWSIRQQALLKEALQTIVIAKAGLPGKYVSPKKAATEVANQYCDIDGPASARDENILSESKPNRNEATPVTRTQELGIQGAKSERSAVTSRMSSTGTHRSLFQRLCTRLEKQLIMSVNRLLANHPLPSGWLARAIRGRVFEIIFVIVILANVIVLILSTDNQIQNSLTGDDTHEETFFACDTAFTAAYTLELACRLYAYRLHFVITIDWRWNLLDVVLTIVAIQDFLIVVSGSLSNKTNLTFLRLIRLLKLLKTLRLMRVLRVFRDLRMMLNSIVGSIYVMAYAFVLIIVVMFAFGIFLSQGTGIYLAESAGTDEAAQNLLIYYWGSVTTSMASLYMAVLGGENWRTMADSLLVVGDGFRLAFFAFVAFFLLVIVNTITSVFVETAIQLGEKDSATQIKEEIVKKNRYVEQLKDLFRRMDLNNDGTVDFNELVASLETEEMVGFLAKLMIDVHDAKLFLQEMSVQGRAKINLDSFVTKCLKIRGPARSIDLISFAGAQQSATSAIFSELSALRSRTEMIEQILLVGDVSKYPHWSKHSYAVHL